MAVKTLCVFVFGSVSHSDIICHLVCDRRREFAVMLLEAV